MDISKKKIMFEMKWTKKKSNYNYEMKNKKLKPSHLKRGKSS